MGEKDRFLTVFFCLPNCFNLPSNHMLQPLHTGNVLMIKMDHLSVE